MNTVMVAKYPFRPDLMTNLMANYNSKYDHLTGIFDQGQRYPFNG